MRMLSVTAVALLAIPSYAGSTGPGTLEDLGEPVLTVLSHDQALGFGPDGEPQAYFVVGGNANVTAGFAAVDIRSGRTVFETRLPRGDTSWATDYSTYEKAVYIGMSDTSGELYRHRSGSQSVESLGVPVPGQRIWGMDVAPDGTVFGGTYPGGRLFSYDPGSSGVHDFGQVVAGETYVRGLEATAERVWIGTQPNAELAMLDRASGAVTRIPLPEPYASWGGATAYDIFERGPRLFVRVTGTGRSALLVHDIASHTWVDAIAEPGTRSVSPLDPADGRTVYFRRQDGHVVAYDVHTLTSTDTGWAPNAIPGDFTWADLGAPGLSLVFTFYYGRVYTYNPVSGANHSFQATLTPAANPLTAIGTGPDGRIYIGAYLSPPGMGRYDPSTGRFDLLSRSGQVEGFGTWNGSLVYGRYPGGGLLSYDVGKPWSFGVNPGPATVIGADQDRPKGLVQVGDTVVAASVPSTGQWGGAMTVWDPVSGTVRVHRNVIADQSPVSAVARDGLVYAGTSIHGGFGVDPKTTDATLFVWDPKDGRVLYRTVPVPGAHVISGLAWGPDNHLYGLAAGALFEFDLDSRTVLRTRQLSTEDYNFRYGDDQSVVFLHGRMFVTTRSELFNVDPVTWKVTTLVGDRNAEGLAADRAGDLYFIGRDTSVYRYDLPADTTAPTVRARVLRPRPAGIAVVVLSATDDDIGVASVQYRVDGGEWRDYDRPFAVSGPGRHTLDYRAVDRAFNASPITTRQF